MLLNCFIKKYPLWLIITSQIIITYRDIIMLIDLLFSRKRFTLTDLCVSGRHLPKATHRLPIIYLVMMQKCNSRQVLISSCHKQSYRQFFYPMKLSASDAPRLTLEGWVTSGYEGG